MRKSFTAIILGVLVFLSSAATNVFAANITVKAEKDTYSYNFKKNETFDITFLLENNTGFDSSSIKVHYDPSVIRAVTSDDNAETDGYLTFRNNGREVRLFDNSFVNSQIEAVASKEANGIYYPDGTADGKKSASEIGYIILSNFSTDIGTHMVGDKKLFTMRFKMIKAGSTSVEIQGIGANEDTKDMYFSTFGVDGNIEGVVSKPAKVVLNGGSAPSPVQKITFSETTEQTTAAVYESTTESTTTDKTASSASGGGRGGAVIRGNSERRVTGDVSPDTEKSGDADAVSSATKKHDDTDAVSSATKKHDDADAVSSATKKHSFFDDLENVPWAAEKIGALAKEGIIKGVSKGKFEPSANVKRGDFLLMLVNGLHLETETDSGFEDIPEGDYRYDAACTAKSLGLAQGREDGLFHPDEYITRQDIIVLAHRALSAKYSLESSDLSVLDKFSDSEQIADYAVQPFADMISAGLIHGNSYGLSPGAYATRAESAVIIYNFLEKYYEREDSERAEQ